MELVVRFFGQVKIEKGYDNRKEIVISETEPHVAMRLKALFKKIPLHADIYRLSITDETCVDLNWFFKRYNFNITEEAKELLFDGEAEYKKRVEETEKIFSGNYVPKKYNLKLPMRDYQAQGTEFLVKNKRGLCGDEIGLGKTLEGTAIWCEPQTLPGAVVVQTHLPGQWLAQIKKFTDLKVHIVKTRKLYELPDADVYIFKYSTLSGWVDVFSKKPFKSVIFDEAQELRHDSSAKYYSAKVLADNCEYAVAFTATPIYNYGIEVFNILDLLKEGCLGDRSEFIREWCAGYGETVINPKALGTFLREKLLFLRRTRREVGRELPPINSIIYEVDYEESEVKKVEDIAKTLALKVFQGNFMERGSAARELDLMMRQSTGIAKARSVATYVRMLLESGEPILLAGWHRKCYEIWMEELKEFNPVLYTGSESPKEKDESTRKFIEGESKLMIISLRSGIGLDGLQDVCSTVVFGELDWSPKVMDQVAGRLDRDGQQRQVTAIYLIANGGSDPCLVDLLGLKNSQATAITDPLKAIEEKESNDSRIKMMARDFLKKRGIEIQEKQTTEEENKEEKREPKQIDFLS